MNDQGRAGTDETLIDPLLRAALGQLARMPRLLVEDPTRATPLPESVAAIQATGSAPTSWSRAGTPTPAA